MGDEARLLVADADSDYQTLLADRIAREPGLRLVGSAATADAAVEMLQSCEADILILDLILPGRDGIYVLKKLREVEHPPAVVVNTSFASPMMTQFCARMNVSALLLKPSDPDLILERVRYANEFRRAHALLPVPRQHAAKRAEPQKQELNREITELMHQLGFSSRYKGYYYLRHAVYEAWKCGYVDRNITKQIYPETARAFGVSSSGVERGIRTLAVKLWENGGTETFQRVMNMSMSKNGITNTELIAFFVEYLNKRFNRYKRA